MDNKSTTKKRVVVGLSGGVDSSVTAALLKEQGFEVIGVYMKNWSEESVTMGQQPLSPDQFRLACPWYDEYLDAKRVALHLDIEFHVWDFREAYKTKVFDFFISETAKGRTPNPDIFCNSLVKFDDFQQKALTEFNADMVATGHYAKLLEENGQRYLAIPKDTHKDQTYFLYRLDQEQLATALFPLADLTKTEVRELAKKFNLPTKYKKDSQGICFIGEVDVRDFVTSWLAPKPGKALTLEGQVVGDHQGIHLYTIGEKLPVVNRLVATLYPELKSEIPHFYVAEKEVDQNMLVVVPGTDHPALFKDFLTLEDVVWSAEPVVDSQLSVRVRHGGELVSCSVQQSTDSKHKDLKIQLNKKIRAIAPGQHAVLYQTDQKTGLSRVVGGGIIK